MLQFAGWEMYAVCDQSFHGTFWLGMFTLFVKLVGYHSRILNLSQDCHWISGCSHWMSQTGCNLILSNLLNSPVVIGAARNLRPRWCCYREVKWTRAFLQFAKCPLSRLYPTYYLNLLPLWPDRNSLWKSGSFSLWIWRKIYFILHSTITQNLWNLSQISTDLSKSLMSWC